MGQPQVSIQKLAPAKVKLDGTAISSGAPSTINHFLLQYDQTDIEPKAFSRALTGKGIEEYWMRDSGITWRAGVMAYHLWQAHLGNVDETALETLDEILYNPQPHNMTTGVLDEVRLNTDGTRTVAILDRQILSNDYIRQNEQGVNNGAAIETGGLAVTSYTGTTYAIGLGAGAPAAGTVNLDITDATYKWRRLVFNAADIAGLGSRKGALRVRALFLYRVSLRHPPRKFASPGNGNLGLGISFGLEEMGEPS